MPKIREKTCWESEMVKVVLRLNLIFLCFAAQKQFEATYGGHKFQKYGWGNFA